MATGTTRASQASEDLSANYTLTCETPAGDAWIHRSEPQQVDRPEALAARVLDSQHSAELADEPADRPESDSESRFNLVAALRAARKSIGTSQRDLADQIGVTPQVIGRLERGVGSLVTLIAVMDATDFKLTGLSAGATLPERLCNTRRKRGISLERLAAKTGLSRTTIVNLESGGGTVASLLRLLDVLAPRLGRQAQARKYWAKDEKGERDSRFTPRGFMEPIYRAFGDVDLDPCGHVLSPVVAARRILASEGGDGLSEDWSGRLVFMNPPFSAALQWLRRAYDQWSTGHVETVVCLVPARTDSAFFHEVLSVEADIYFLQGRVKFLSPAGKAQQTPFSLMVLALGTTDRQRAIFSELVSGFWMSRVATGTN